MFLNPVRMTSWVLEALLLKDPPKKPQTITWRLLRREDDRTSEGVIRYLEEKNDLFFKALAQTETDMLLARDAEDDEKIAKGIAFSVSRGVLQADPPVEPITMVDVQGKTADEVANEIIAKLGDAYTKGCILVLQGLSGTGKGTTVSKLKSQLPNSICWSNGNVFRSLTLMAVTWCEKNKKDLTPEVLTPALVKELMGMLQFLKREDGNYDIKITGFGMDYWVQDIARTILQEPRVAKNIPTVAEATQGEVIAFAGQACEIMRGDGSNVLLEGRAPTLAYVRTPHRFELTMTDINVLGKRRAAQRIMARALKTAKDQGGEVKEDYGPLVAEATQAIAVESGITKESIAAAEKQAREKAAQAATAVKKAQPAEAAPEAEAQPAAGAAAV